MVDDLLAIVFNGCIYNHRPLRAELSKAGRTFRSDHSDTEAAIQAFGQWKTAFASRMEGMFAIGVWDRKHGRLVVARDRAGEKPLYVAEFVPGGGGYQADGKVFAFASTVPALVRLMHESQCEADVIDPKVMARWIRFGFDADVPYTGITAVRPGDHATTSGEASGWVHRAYYELPSRREPGKSITLDDLDRVLAKAVAERMESDVPLGCFLSGGIDSSLIAAYASKAKPGLRTFCVRMKDPRLDESQHARTVARRIGSKHTTLEVSPKPAEDLVRLIAELGLPLGDSSLLPTAWVSRAARQHVTVALSGDGGDELFMGYDRYRAAQWLRQYGPMLSTLPAGRLERFGPRTKLNKLGRMAIAARYGGYEELLSIFPTPDLERVMTGIHPAETMHTQGGTRIADPARFDAGLYLPEDLLRKVDTASMSVALEVRAPLLATSVMDLAMTLPTEVLTNGGPKGLLRALARRYLPESITSRPKSGFAIPIGEWFRSDYGKLKTLLMDTANTPGAFDGLGVQINIKGVRAMIDEHMKGARDHGQRLYAVTVLGVWRKTR
jgi:asparagine synthase (glutamine-hydrolysing)